MCVHYSRLCREEVVKIYSAFEVIENCLRICFNMMCAARENEIESEEKKLWEIFMTLNK